MTNISQEHAGLAYVHSICAKMNSIWRPTSGNDLGIDGIIEFLEDGRSVSTGLMVGVQVKSGPSYFDREQNGHYVYYPSQNNLLYWKNYILPVILIIYQENPSQKVECLFTNVKAQITNLEKKKILIKKDTYFTSDRRDELMNLSNIHRVSPNLIRETLERLKRIKYYIGYSWEADTLNLTGIDLLLAFVNYRKDYFHVNSGRIFEILRIVNDSNGISYNEELLVLFFERFIINVSYFNITESFWEDFSEIYYDYKLFSDVLVNLTDYGTQLLKYLIENAEQYIELKKYSHIQFENISELVDTICARCESSIRHDSFNDLIVD